jgi:hypothetical protein
VRLEAREDERAIVSKTLHGRLTERKGVGMRREHARRRTMRVVLVARPRKIFWMVDDAGTHGVEFDVTVTVQAVSAVLRER